MKGANLSWYIKPKFSSAFKKDLKCNFWLNVQALNDDTFLRICIYNTLVIHFQENYPRKKQFFFRPNEIEIWFRTINHRITFSILCCFHMYVLYCFIQIFIQLKKYSSFSFSHMKHTYRNDLPKCRHEDNALDYLQLELLNLTYYFPKI